MQIRPAARQLSSESAERNSLLRAIPDDAYHRVMAHAKSVRLRLGETVIAPGEPISHAWFPQTGLLSVVTELEENKASVEIGIIGRQGFAGVPLLHGIDTQPYRVITQIPGVAKRIPTEAFTRILREVRELATVLHRYTAALMNQATQQVACNRLHTLEQRLARWLLTAHDHMDGGELPLTQEFLAIMLGVRRPGVTVAAQTLESGGLIKYKRGRITVTDRVGLEKLSCECYDRIQSDFEKLLGPYMIPRARGSEEREARLA